MMRTSTSTSVNGMRTSFGRDSLIPYLRVRPLGFLSWVRLYMGYGAALCRRIFSGSAGYAVGAAVPGRTLLAISFLGIKASIRPGTNDLDLLVHHEPKTLSWFRVGAGQVVVDVGAHIGRYTLIAARAGAKVFSLEPDPSNFQILDSNVRLNRFHDVALHPIALSNAAGRRTLTLSNGTNRGTSALSSGARELSVSESARQVPVECLTLDDFASAEHIPEIDWLKIDVEGHEREVLDGATHTLQHTKRLILEVSAGNEDECRGRLDRAGFELRAVEAGYPTSNWLLVR